MKEEIRQIIERVGCSLEEAEALYNITKNAEEAVTLYNSIKETEHIFVLKGRFSAEKVYGLFVIHTFIEGKRAGRSLAAVSSHPHISILDVDSSWDVFEQDVQNALGQRSRLDLKKTKSLNKSLRKLAHTPSFLEALAFMNRESVFQILKERIERVVGKKVELKIALEQIPSFVRSTPEAVPHRMRGSLVLAPVAGKAAKDLKEGEQILLQIKDEDFLPLFGQNPIVANIKKVRRTGDNRVHVVADLGPKMEAETILPQSVRVKTPQPQVSLRPALYKRGVHIILLLIILLLIVLLLR
jgi:hypothetical protein